MCQNFLPFSGWVILTLYLSTTSCLSTRLLMDTGSFPHNWLLWIMLLWTRVCNYLNASFHLFWVYTCDEIAGSIILNFLRNCQTWAAHWPSTTLYSHQQGTDRRAPFLQILANTGYFPFIIFVIIRAIPVGTKWYFVVVLICISLMTSDVTYLPVCLLAIRMPSLDHCCSRVCPL